jgi:hypothetical protein
MAGAQPVNASLPFPDLIAASAQSDGFSEPGLSRRVPDVGLGAFRGLVFALLFEVLIGFAAFELWSLLR